MGKVALAVFLLLAVFYPVGVSSVEQVASEVKSVASREIYDPDPNRAGYFANTGSGKYAGWAFVESSSAEDEAWHLLLAVHHPNDMGAEALVAMGDALMQMWHSGAGTIQIHDLLLRAHGSEIVALKT